MSHPENSNIMCVACGAESFAPEVEESGIMAHPAFPLGLTKDCRILGLVVCRTCEVPQSSEMFIERIQKFLAGC